MIADALYVAFGLKTDPASMKRAESAIDSVGGKLKGLFE